MFFKLILENMSKILCIEELWISSDIEMYVRLKIRLLVFRIYVLTLKGFEYLWNKPLNYSI